MVFSCCSGGQRIITKDCRCLGCLGWNLVPLSPSAKKTTPFRREHSALQSVHQEGHYATVAASNHMYRILMQFYEFHLHWQNPRSALKENHFKLLQRLKNYRQVPSLDFKTPLVHFSAEAWTHRRHRDGCSQYCYSHMLIRHNKPPHLFV